MTQGKVGSQVLSSSVVKELDNPFCKHNGEIYRAYFCCRP